MITISNGYPVRRRFDCIFGGLYEKIVILVLVLVTLFSLTSCGVDYRVSLDENLHGKSEKIATFSVFTALYI